MPGLVNVDLGSALGGIGTLAKDIRAAITGKTVIDAEKAAEFAQKADELKAGLMEAQSAINLADANSGSNYRGGWRPFIGWTCGISVALTYVVKPITEWILAIAKSSVVLPSFDMTALMGLLTPLLGMAIARSFDKKNGVDQ